MSTNALPRAGSELAGYRLAEQIGRGGMGVVYRALDEGLERSVAVKLIAAELAGDAAFRERFLAESRLAASLDHPNVVPVYDAGEADGRLYLAMRFVPGRDLGSALAEDGPLEPGRALAICRQVAEALDAAHERGLVHRDVKPSNVLLDEREHAYLADFGLTRRLAEQAPGGRSGLSIGTPAYVSPEQIEGREVDGRADQYSLACVLYQCLTGEPPFRGPTALATLLAHLEEPPPAYPGLEKVFVRALAKQPHERYETCSAFVASVVEALPAAGHTRRWRGALVTALVVTALLAVGLAGFFLAGSSEPRAAQVAPPGDGRVVRIDPATGETLSSISFGDDLSDVVTAPGSVWVASLGSGELARIDPDSAEIVETLSVAGAGRGPSGVAASRELVGVVNGADDRIRLYEASEGRFSSVESYFPATAGCACPDEELPAVADDSWLWTVSRSQDSLVRFSAEAGSAETVTLPGGSDPAGLGVGENAVWVVTTTAPTVIEVDPETNRVIGRTKLPATTVPSSVAVGEGAVWVADLSGDAVLRIESRLRSDSTLTHLEGAEVVARIPVGRGPNDLAVGLGHVWVANYLDGTLSRIDPATNAVVDTISVAPWPEHIAVGESGVWVTHDAPEDGGTT